MDWLESLILGALQGLTEFLPISSSGHLVVVQGAFAALDDRTLSGSDELFFNVMLHLGTLGAILAYYRGAAAMSLRGLLGDPGVPPGFDRPAVVRAGTLAVVATLPAVAVGLTMKDAVERATASPLVAGVGFLITAAILLTTQAMRSGAKGPAETSWADALLVGMAQAVAILPGVSRSGSTIVAALALGFARPWAVGFSLLMAVPAILGAGVLEARDVNPATLTPDRLAPTAAATVVAGLVGYGAIVWLIRIVRGRRLWYFSVYLLVLAGVVLLNFPIGGGTDARPSRAAALDRPDRRAAVGEGPGGPAAGGPLPVDRADGGGAGAGPAGPGAGRSGRP